MVRTGGHDYYQYTRNNEKFLLVFGDCEYNESRRFLNSLNQHIIDSLFNAIMITIWDTNKYNVRNHQEDTYLLGESSTQDFIVSVASETTFFGLCPFNLICLADVAFGPYSPDPSFRWKIQLDFGSANEFHLNQDPNNPDYAEINH